MSKYTAVTMRALGFAPRTDAVDNKPTAQPATRQIDTLSWVNIVAQVRAGTVDQLPRAAADRNLVPPSGNHGWDAIAAALIAEAGMQNALGGRS